MIHLYRFKEFCKTYKKTKPELVLLLGDRFEVLTAALAATFVRFQLHIHGGELTEGSLDDVFRHSISKMSICILLLRKHTEKELFN